MNIFKPSFNKAPHIIITMDEIDYFYDVSGHQTDFTDEMIKRFFSEKNVKLPDDFIIDSVKFINCDNKFNKLSYTVKTHSGKIPEGVKKLEFYCDELLDIELPNSLLDFTFICEKIHNNVILPENLVILFVEFTNNIEKIIFNEKLEDIYIDDYKNVKKLKITESMKYVSCSNLEEVELVNVGVVIDTENPNVKILNPNNLPIINISRDFINSIDCCINGVSEIIKNSKDFVIISS